MNIDDHDNKTLGDVRAGTGTSSFVDYHQHLRKSGNLERTYIKRAIGN